MGGGNSCFLVKPGNMGSMMLCVLPCPKATPSQKHLPAWNGWSRFFRLLSDIQVTPFSLGFKEKASNCFQNHDILIMARHRAQQAHGFVHTQQFVFLEHRGVHLVSEPSQILSILSFYSLSLFSVCSGQSHLRAWTINYLGGKPNILLLLFLFLKFFSFLLHCFYVMPLYILFEVTRNTNKLHVSSNSCFIISEMRVYLQFSAPRNLGFTMPVTTEIIADTSLLCIVFRVMVKYKRDAEAETDRAAHRSRRGFLCVFGRSGRDNGIQANFCIWSHWPQSRWIQLQPPSPLWDLLEAV